MKKIFTPQYIPGFSLIYPFQDEFGDASIAFIVLRYRIAKGYFRSRLANGDYPQFRNVIDLHGNAVMAGADIDYRNYRLLSETVSDSNFVVEVEETYGYTPTKTYSEPALISWQSPDTQSPNVFSGNVITQILPQQDLGDIGKLYFDNSQGLVKANSTIRLQRLYYSQGTSYWNFADFGEFIVITADAESCLCSNMSEETIRGFYSGGDAGLYPSNFKLAYTFNNTIGESRDFTATKKTSFFTFDASNPPTLNSEFRVYLGDTATNQISQYTTPDYSTWQAMRQNRSLIRPQADSYSKVLGNLYSLTTYTITAQ